MTTALFDAAPFTEERPEADEAPGVTLPYFNGPFPGGYGGFMATEEQRMAVLGRLFAQEGRDLADVPEAHRRRGPLSCWCWLVLVTNGLTPEFMSDGQPYTLVHYGIDLGFSAAAVRSWTFWLA